MKKQTMLLSVVVAISLLMLPLMNVAGVTGFLTEGEILWEDDENERIQYIHYHSDYVYYVNEWNVGDEDDGRIFTLYKRSLEDGDKEWATNLTRPSGEGLRVYDIEISGGDVYILRGCEFIQVISDSSGRIKEEIKMEYCGLTFSGAFDLDNDRVFVGTGEGNMLNVSVETGEIKYTEEIYTEGDYRYISDMVYDDGWVYMIGADEDHDVVARNVKSDEVIGWHRKYHNDEVVNIDIEDDTIYYTDNGGNIYALESKNGNMKWQTSGVMGDAYVSTDDLGVYVGFDNGNVSAFDQESGELKWAHTNHTSSISSMASYEGYVISGDESGTIIVYDSMTYIQRLTRWLLWLILLAIIIAIIGIIFYFIKNPFDRGDGF